MLLACTRLFIQDNQRERATMPECFDTLDTAFAAVARDKEKKRLWTMQWKVNTWTFTGHAEERMLLNFGALYTQFAVASG